MTPEMVDLARRAVACKGWRWMAGMLAFCPDGTNDPVRICFGSKAARMGPDDRWVRPAYIVSHELPDLTDPATLGCLLALVREAWRDSSIIAEPSLGMWEISRSDGCGLRTAGVWGGGGRGRGGFVFRPTEVDALVTALEVEGELTARGRAALKAAP